MLEVWVYGFDHWSGVAALTSQVGEPETKVLVKTYGSVMESFGEFMVNLRPKFQ